jgi:antitoxin ParD1/3/4
MTIELKPEDEQLIQKCLRSGGFSNVDEVIHHALRVQDAEEARLQLHKREAGEKIDKAIAECDRGGGIPASEVRRHLREMKTTQLHGSE